MNPRAYGETASCLNHASSVLLPNNPRLRGEHYNTFIDHMNRWLKLIIWKLISAPIVRTVTWTEDERASFDSFLRSSCGKKFFEFLRQSVAQATFNAVYRAVSAEVANAHARGMQDVLGLIVRLHRLPPEASETGEDIEPTPAQRAPVDGRVFGLSGNSAIN